MARANSGLSSHVKDTCWSRVDHCTLIKAQLSALNVATKRGTSDKTEATRFSQCAHDQRRRLEAEDCDSIQFNFRWEETYTPTTLFRSRSPHNVLHSPSYCVLLCNQQPLERKKIMLVSVTGGRGRGMEVLSTVMEVNLT